MEEIAEQIGALVAALTPIASTVDVNGILEMIFLAFLMFGIGVIAFWQKDHEYALFIYIVAGFITLFVALSLIDDYTGISISLIGLACLYWFLAVISANEGGGPARGWQQIKGWFNNVRGSG